MADFFDPPPEQLAVVLINRASILQAQRRFFPVKPAVPKQKFRSIGCSIA
jgi:hypothetical protein